MYIIRKFQELSDFLGAWFPDSDLEFKSTRDVVGEYVLTAGEEERGSVLAQIDELLDEADFPFQELSELTNLHFEDSEEARVWLRDLGGLIRGLSAGR